MNEAILDRLRYFLIGVDGREEFTVYLAPVGVKPEAGRDACR